MPQPLSSSGCARVARESRSLRDYPTAPAGAQPHAACRSRLLRADLNLDVDAPRGGGTPPRAQGPRDSNPGPVALPDEELRELWNEANQALGQLMAGLVGRRAWDDDVQELCEAVYDAIPNEAFLLNLYNAITMPLAVFPPDRGSIKDELSFAWDPEEFCEAAEELRNLAAMEA
jgi:hypothetical protein